MLSGQTTPLLMGQTLESLSLGGQMMNVIYWKAMALFMTGHALSWFQLNSHMVFDWWKGKEYLAVLVFGVPAGFMFLFGWVMAAGESGELWMPRFLAFCASWVPFPLLTWYFMGETPFTWKTITCFFLACCILAVQLWR